MTCAESFVKHANGFFTWHSYDESVKTELWSTVIADGRRLILVDPAPLEISTLNEIMRVGTPVAIFITSGNHERESARIKSILNIPLGSHALAIPHLSGKPEIVVDAASRLYNLTPISIHGAGPGEVALYHTPSKSLVLGDALINLGQTGFAFLPDKYCENPQQMRESLKKLLEVDFDSLFFAHGEPILSGAKEKFQSLVK